MQERIQTEMDEEGKRQRAERGKSGILLLVTNATCLTNPIKQPRLETTC